MTDRLTVRINHPCGRLIARAGWSRSRENSLSLRDHELWLVWRGQGWMQTHAGRFDLRPGFCAWMRPGGVYDAGLRGGHGLGFTFIHFTCDLADPPEFFWLRDVTFFDAATRRIVELVRRAPESRWGQPADAGPEATVLLEAVLQNLLARPEPRPQPPRSPHREAIEAIAADMRDHPEQPLAVRDLAARLGVTLPHFSRLFRSILGLSPRQYHLRARLDRARYLLAESNLSVTDTARALGYRDVFLFSKQFSRHVGVNPTAYRRSPREA